MARGFAEYTLTQLESEELGKDHLSDHQTKLLILATLKLIQGRFQITTETNTFTKILIEYMKTLNTLWLKLKQKAKS